MPTSGPWQGHSQIVFSVPLCRCFRIKHTGCIHARARTCGRTCAGVGVSVLACLRALLRAGTTACTHARLHPHAHTPVRASAHVRSCAGVPVRARECTCTNACLRVGMSMSENVLTRACARVCVYVCMSVQVCMFVFVKGQRHANDNKQLGVQAERKNEKTRKTEGNSILIQAGRPRPHLRQFGRLPGLGGLCKYRVLSMIDMSCSALYAMSNPSYDVPPLFSAHGSLCCAFSF